MCVCASLAEALLAEEAIAVERQQMDAEMTLKADIADYEMIEIPPTPATTTMASESRGFKRSEEDSVPCPVCRSAYLFRTAVGVILCPNTVAAATSDSGIKNGGTMTGFSRPSLACNLRLDVASEGLALSHLREQLRSAYEEHGRGGCPGTLVFLCAEQFGVTTLSASCTTCRASAVII